MTFFNVQNFLWVLPRHYSKAVHLEITWQYLLSQVCLKWYINQFSYNLLWQFIWLCSTNRYLVSLLASNCLHRTNCFTVRWRTSPELKCLSYGMIREGSNVEMVMWYKRLKYKWLRFLDQIAEVLSSAFSHSWHTCNQELERRQYRACCGTSDMISPPSSPDPSLFPCWNLDRTLSTPTTGVARMTRWGRESQSTLTTVCACCSLIVHA